MVRLELSSGPALHRPVPAGQTLTSHTSQGCLTRDMQQSLKSTARCLPLLHHLSPSGLEFRGTLTSAPVVLQASSFSLDSHLCVGLRPEAWSIPL